MQLYVVRSKVDKTNEEEKKQYYGIPIISGVITEEKIAEEISERCSLTPSDVLAALDALSRSLQQHLEDGRSVRLKGIGTFNVSATSSGADTPEECTPSKMKAGRIYFRADKILKSVLGKMKYKLKKTGKNN